MNSVEKNIITPPSESDHRLLFQYAFQRNNTAEMSFMSMGAQLEYSRSRAMRLLADNNGDVDATLTATATLREGMARNLSLSYDAIDSNQSASYALSCRANLYKNLADQLSLLPAMFSQKVNNYDAHRVRKQLISGDGMYGIIGEVLENAFTEIQVANSSIEHRGLVGYINELTAIALLNRNQNSNFVALPSLPSDDILKKVDIDVFHYQSNMPQKVGFQVKTSSHWSPEAGGVPIINA
ncbi:MAG: hypothetical protein ACMG55_18120, partial [Microcoleus sp.]